MISNIINKEIFRATNSGLDILWTNPDSEYFTNFITEAWSPCVLVDFEKTFYGVYNIGLVVCNNRLIYLERCLELAKFFHSPLIIVDHFVKSDMINSEFNMESLFDPIYQVATSKEIFTSWNNIHTHVAPYKNDNKSMESWQNILTKIISCNFVIREEKQEEKDHDQ